MSGSWWPLKSQAKLVHLTDDEWGSIVVLDYRKHRVMTFDTPFEQSKIHRKWPHVPVHEYNRAMLLPVAMAAPERALILGLGGGVMASALMHLLPEVRVTAIERRSAVIDIAKRYFWLPDDPRLTIRVGEAEQQMDDLAEGQTDFVMADLYDADRMSSSQARTGFIEQCDRVLSDHGWLSINHHRAPDYHSRFFDELRKRFATVLMLATKTNNTVLYASKQTFEIPGSQDPRLLFLQKRLPIDWQRLMTRVQRIH